MTNSKAKRKVNGTQIAAITISTLIILGIIGFCLGVGVVIYMLKDKPEMEISKFENPESSVIYDSQGNIAAELGMTIRQNISYDDLPNVLVDAFVAVEDSRFFEHNGFDVPRFTKAILANLKTMSFGQGGSTFTMQLVKNTYFVDDEAGVNAPKKVSRKVQEIALAFELEGITNKKVIFENYVNKLNFGGSYNIRGIQKASQYYYGKDVNELNLAESALLAGVINAPNAYNPFKNLELATKRRNEVLYLMNYHGYISDTEYELAKAIKVEDLLQEYVTNKGAGNGIAYQAYIDTVISEVYKLTGLDPYTTPMRIYTYMDAELQSIMDDIQAGEVEDYFSFPDEEFEIASISYNNKTGAINGVLGGRNYADGGALLLNHATSQYKQPGSSIKPILEYVLAFENLGWATSHVVVDKPIVYPGTSLVISNANGNYAGQVTLADAIGNSLNTPAIQTLQAVIDAKSKNYVVDYLNSMGFNVTLENFNIQFAIGGGELAVSCEQMAAAQGALINGGQYIEPHTIARIEFLEGKSPVTPVYTSTQTVSAEAAYLVSQMLYNNVYGSYSNLMQILRDNYAVYAKTGTTDWGTSGREYGIPTGSIKDAWMIGSTTEYTIVTWCGYEKAQKDKQSYITYSAYLQNIQGRITNMLLDANVEINGNPEPMSRPSGVVSIEHILGTYPYASPIEGMDQQYVVQGLIKKEYASLISPETVEIKEMTSDPEITLNNSTLTIKWPEYPDPDKLQVAPDAIDISLKRSDGSKIIDVTGKRLFDYSWIYGPVRYKAEIKVNDVLVMDTIRSESNTVSVNINTNPGDKVEACAYYGYDSRDINSVKRCKTEQVVDNLLTLTIPDSLSTNDVQNWANANGIAISFTAERTNDPALADKVKEYTGNKVVDGTVTSDNQTYHAGNIISIYQSQKPLLALVCHYYTYEDSVAITAPSGPYVANTSYQFAATSTPANAPLTWTCSSASGSGVTIDTNGLLHIPDGFSGDIIVTVALTNNLSKTSSITINVQ